jgi:hypothetical protein
VLVQGRLQGKVAIVTGTRPSSDQFQAMASSRRIGGAYFRMTEASFASKEDLDAALNDDIGINLVAAARSLEESYGVRLEILVVADPS